MIVVVDYGMGNAGSVKNMIARAGLEVTMSGEVNEIRAAQKLVLPGVGAFDAGMKNLASRGLIPILNQKVLVEKTPILGICLGMQLFTQRSEEGISPGLGWLDAETVRFKFTAGKPELKIPHMGWSQLMLRNPGTLFQGCDTQARFYFVHSYHVRCNQESDVTAFARHGMDFVAAVEHENIMGTQFHPEKSHRYGMALVKNFATAPPRAF